MQLKMQDAMPDAKCYLMRATKLKLATLFGATLLNDALARLVLALTLDASTFPAVSRVVSWSILGVGLPVLLRIRRLGTARDVA